MYYAIFTQFHNDKPVRKLCEGTFCDKRTAYSAMWECEKYDHYTDAIYMVKPTTVYKKVVYRPVAREVALANPEIFGSEETEQQKWV